MSSKETFSGSVLRVFEARVKPGCADEFLQKFATSSVDVVKDQPGNLGHFVGQNVSEEGETFLFVSIWKDLDAVRSLFGDDWESSYLPPGYAEIIEDCSVKHIALENNWPPTA